MLVSFVDKYFGNKEEEAQEDGMEEVQCTPVDEQDEADFSLVVKNGGSAAGGTSAFTGRTSRRTAPTAVGRLTQSKSADQVSRLRGPPPPPAGFATSAVGGRSGAVARAASSSSLGNGRVRSEERAAVRRRDDEVVRTIDRKIDR